MTPKTLPEENSANRQKVAESSKQSGAKWCVNLRERPLTNAEIEKLMSRFDFQHVRDHMVKTGWTWKLSKTPPTIEELKECAIELLQRFRIGWVRSGTGGFEVSTDIRGKPALSFVVEQSDTYNYD